MTFELDEAIKYCEGMAEEQDMKAGFETDNQTYTMSETERERYRECAEEHRQLAKWLRELKFCKDRQDLINKSWQELIRYKEGIEIIKMRSQAYRERGETILASGIEQALDILKEVNADARDID